MKILVSCVLSLQLLGPTLQAQMPRSAVEPNVLQVTPAALPQPALKYQLLPDAKDLSSGNAVQLYYRAFAPELHAWYARHRWRDRLRLWLKLSYEQAVQDQPALPDKDSLEETEPPIPQTKKSDLLFLRTSKQLEELDRAARRSYADWELWDRARQEGPSLLLPEVYSFYDFALMLRARIRLCSMEGDFSQAIHSLQTGFAMVQHLVDSGLLINSLVAISIAEQLCDSLEEIVQLPRSPNLYWALSHLPSPLVDLRRPLEADRLLYLSLFTDLQELQKRNYSKEEMAFVFDRLLEGVERTGGGRLRGNFDALSIGLLISREYPAAKAWLASIGRTPEQIDSMPASQAILLYANDRFQSAADDFLKWYGMPAPIARPKLYLASEQFKVDSTPLDLGKILAKLMLPSAHRIYDAQLNVERRLTALRTVEALRFHASTHHGQFPASLAQIQDLPIPNDPATGRPLQYAIDKNQITLRGAGLQPPLPRAVDYRVTLR